MNTQTVLSLSAALLISTIQTDALALDAVTANSAALPALAAGDAPSTEKATTDSSNAEPSTTEAPGKAGENQPKQPKLIFGKYSLEPLKKCTPGAMAAFATGAVVGLPFACKHHIVDETQQANHDLIKDSKNPILVVPVTIFSLPFTIPIGTLFGTGHAIKNSWVNKNDKPFSKDAFSLGQDF
jgi:hypothetical protein